MTRKVIEASGEDRLRASSRSDESAGPAQQDAPNPMLSQGKEETVEARARGLRQREVQLIGAGLSNRDWHAVETAYNQLRDKLDDMLRPKPVQLVPARSGIEAQHGLNDVFPGDLVPAALAPPIREHGEGVREALDYLDRLAIHEGCKARVYRQAADREPGTPYAVECLRKATDADREGAQHRAFAEKGRAALSAQPVKDAVLPRYLSDRFEWAAPGDQQEDAWIVRFCDKDCGDQIWTGPDAAAEAWASWERYAPSYNIYVFQLARLSPKSPASVGLDPETALRAALPEKIGRLSLGERLSKEHYCGGSHDMPDGQPIYWQERGGEYPDDIDGYCLTCAIQQAESDSGWCECSIKAALAPEDRP